VHAFLGPEGILSFFPLGRPPLDARGHANPPRRPAGVGPAGAQGMNTGIQDDWSLGWKFTQSVVA
jgi:hypothetical protein